MRTSTSWNKELSEKELTPHCPQQLQRNSQMYIFTIITFLFFKKIKSFITPLNFIFVTYYYLAKKKKDPIFKANFISILK